ncbi:MAG TPA: PspC domain-containing protein [Opitutaceae bacterium]|nr:PspC domain-containing protein [Opitutaceae bacterium]
MNKVITINLGGTAYQLEEGGYDTLRTYLETAAARLQGNPDRDEIMSDIEQAIGEKFRALLGSHKTVVITKEVTAVLDEMGPIEDDSGAGVDPRAGEAKARAETGESGPAQTERPPGQMGAPKRFYRIKDGAMLAGVCNGIAAYFNIDPTLVRLAFILLLMVWGTGVLVYFVLAIVVPKARSPEEKAAACGEPFTAQEFIRRAKEGYYGAMKDFPDRKARREWKRRFKQEMRANRDQWRHNWHRYWSESGDVHPRAGIALPLLSVLHGAAAILWGCALISLLATGAVFGIVLSSIVPIWIAVLVMLIAYKIFVWPLKAARRVCYYGYGRPRWASPFVFMLDALIWLAVMAVLLWLGSRYLPQLGEAIRNIPSVAHDAVHQIRQWWTGK